MEWKSLKDQWPPSNSEVVAYYFFHVNDIDEGEPDYGVWHAEVVHEKFLDKICTTKDIFWIKPPQNHNRGQHVSMDGVNELKQQTD